MLSISVRWWERRLCLALCSALCILSACSGGEDPVVGFDPEAPGIGVRTPHPTFTPTPNARGQVVATPPEVNAPTNTVAAPPTVASDPPTATPTPVPPTPAPLPTDTPTSPPAKPVLVINSGDVNIRSGPSTDYDILTVVNRGEEYEVVGKNGTGDWWQICCVAGEFGWVISEFADTDGPVDQVAVVSGEEVTPASGGGEPAAPATSVPVTSTVATLEFDLIVQEQFPESKLVRIYLYVYDKDVGLEGYSLRVTRDGAELRIKQTSFGGSPGFTWPVADVRQRSQNLKVEFPGIAPAGQWEVQLIKDGAPVGPAALFTLTANDPNQELYVRYQKRS